MELNQNLRRYILEAVENQLNESNPPIVTETYSRLLKEGFSKTTAKAMIGSALTIEIYETLHNAPYDEARYSRNLKKLGKE